MLEWALIDVASRIAPKLKHDRTMSVPRHCYWVITSTAGSPASAYPITRAAG
jgi:hypothetical protein